MGIRVDEGTPLIIDNKVITPEIIAIAKELGLNSNNLDDVTTLVGKILGHHNSYYKRMNLDNNNPLTPDSANITSQVTSNICIVLSDDGELQITELFDDIQGSGATAPYIPAS